MADQGIQIQVHVEQVFEFIDLIDNAFSPGAFTARLFPAFDKMAHTQQEHMFATQGEGEWPELSAWREEERGSATPILNFSGSFREEVSHYRGDAVVDTLHGVAWVYPGRMASGRYWGITAGQKVNPLARYTGPRGASRVRDRPIPMAQVPRPILFGGEKFATEVRSIFAEFVRASGIVVEA